LKGFAAHLLTQIEVIISKEKIKFLFSQTLYFDDDFLNVGAKGI